jgi:hypothetical protein
MSVTTGTGWEPGKKMSHTVPMDKCGSKDKPLCVNGWIKLFSRRSLENLNYLSFDFNWKFTSRVKASGAGFTPSTGEK